MFTSHQTASIGRDIDQKRRITTPLSRQHDLRSQTIKKRSHSVYQKERIGIANRTTSRRENINTILTFCVEGIDHRNLLSKSKLRRRQLDKYLESLFLKQLITKNNDRFYVTQQVREFIDNYHQLHCSFPH
ncbi:MAG: winged helix-turn-helix domain-containing protein [Planctomycetota bacterium]